MKLVRLIFTFTVYCSILTVTSCRKSSTSTTKTSLKTTKKFPGLISWKGYEHDEIQLFTQNYLLRDTAFSVTSITDSTICVWNDTLHKVNRYFLITKPRYTDTVFVDSTLNITYVDVKSYTFYYQLDYYYKNDSVSFSRNMQLPGAGYLTLYYTP